MIPIMQETMYSHQPQPATDSGEVRPAAGGYSHHDLPGEFSILAPPDGLLHPLQNMSALQTEPDDHIIFDTYTYPNWAAAGTLPTWGSDYGRRTRPMYPHRILDIPTISAQTYRQDHYIQVRERNNLPNREMAYMNSFEEEDEIMILDDMGIVSGEEDVEREGGLSEKLILKCLKTRDSCPVNNNDEEPKICVVCQDDLCRENSTVGVLDCGHEYHASCIREWLQQKNICPLCKAIALRVDGDDDERS